MARTHQELTLTSDLKGKKKGVFYYMRSRRKYDENVGQVLNGTSNLMMANTNKVAVFNSFWQQKSRTLCLVALFKEERNNW